MKRAHLGGVLAVSALLALAALGYRRSAGRELSADAAGATAPPTTSVIREPLPPAETAMAHEYVGPETGSGTVRGEVVDESDEGVAHATVTLAGCVTQATSTDAKGVFELHGLPPCRFQLVARADSRVGMAVADATTAETILVRLRQAPAVRVTVRDVRRERPVRGATLELVGIASARAETDDEGRATLPAEGPGRYVVRASAEGFAPAVADVVVTSAAGGDVTLGLESGAPLRGNVVDDTGAPVAGAQVWYERSGVAMSVALAPAAIAEADAAGRFTFASVGAGTYRLRARHPRFVQTSPLYVTASGRDPVEGLVLRMNQGATIHGRVRDGNGRPVGAAEVLVRPRGTTGAMDVAWETRADDDGRFVLRNLPKQPLVAVARGSAGISTPVSFDSGELEGELDLRITSPATIRGTVVTRQGGPVYGAMVRAYRDVGASDPLEEKLDLTLSAQTDFDGRFTVPVPGSGEFVLRIARPGAAKDMSAFGPIHGRAVPNGPPVRLVLQDGGTIRGRVEDEGGPLRDVSVVLDHAPATPSPGRGGEFTLTEVMPGSHNLVITGATFEPLVVPGVDVREGETTDIGTLRVRSGRSLTGQVLTSRGAPAAGAHVYVGQRLVATGEEFLEASWAAPGAPGTTKHVVADTDGRYRIQGLEAIDLSIAAELRGTGRSAILKVPAAGGPAHLDLVLEATGSIEGLASSRGKPAVGETITASPARANNQASLFTTTDEQGHFRIEAAPPGAYFVTVSHGTNPLGGVNQFGKMVEVRGGAATSVRLETAERTVTLTVQVMSLDGRSVPMAEVHTFGGKVEASTALEVRERGREVSDGFYGFNIALQGASVLVRDLPADQPYSVCVVPYPPGLESRAVPEIQRYAQAEGKSLPATCIHTRAPSAGEASETVRVPLPPPLTSARETSRKE